MTSYNLFCVNDSTVNYIYSLKFQLQAFYLDEPN